MNQSAHQKYGRKPSALSVLFSVTADAATSPLQAVMLLGKENEAPTGNQDNTQPDQDNTQPAQPQESAEETGHE